MKNILVLGSRGMAGHVIALSLSKNKDMNIYNVSHTHKLNDKSIVLDVMDAQRFNECLDGLELDAVVNCIGVLNDFAEKFKDRAAFINGYLPHFLEEKYKNTRTKVIHISTDCVFSGKDGNYDENSFRDGDSFYSRTKAVGEIMNEKDLTIRTSIIGPDMNEIGIGLFNWFMKSKNQINGYINHIWTGVTTIELAKTLEVAMSTNLTGLYHLVPSEKISKYDLLNLFCQKFERKDLTINKFESDFVDKSLINIRRDFSYLVNGFEQMIEEMKDWIYDNKELYPHYLEILGSKCP